MNNENQINVEIEPATHTRYMSVCGWRSPNMIAALNVLFHVKEDEFISGINLDEDGLTVKISLKRQDKKEKQPEFFPDDLKWEL